MIKFTGKAGLSKLAITVLVRFSARGSLMSQREWRKNKIASQPVAWDLPSTTVQFSFRRMLLYDGRMSNMIITGFKPICTERLHGPPGLVQSLGE